MISTTSWRQSPVFSELALEDAMAGNPTPDELKNIIDSAERAKSLIKKIMVFSRKAELAQKALYLNELVTNLIVILQRTLPKMISIRTELENGLRLINGDPSQIELVILNLASNAQDAMPGGGTLSIKTRNVLIDEDSPHLQLAAEPGNYVLLTVSDTGIGMDKETMRHVFEPFYTTKEVGKGTGMGLASVYGAVKSHGGFITCTSEPGAGTVFDCYLPAISRPRQVEKPAEPRMRKKLEGAETILLVDDEKNLRDLGGRMLNLSGYRVVKAESGEEAVEIYRQQGPRAGLGAHGPEHAGNWGAKGSGTNYGTGPRSQDHRYQRLSHKRLQGRCIQVRRGGVCGQAVPQSGFVCRHQKGSGRKRLIHAPQASLPGLSSTPSTHASPGMPSSIGRGAYLYTACVCEPGMASGRPDQGFLPALTVEPKPPPARPGSVPRPPGWGLILIWPPTPWPNPNTPTLWDHLETPPRIFQSV